MRSQRFCGEEEQMKGTGLVVGIVVVLMMMLVGSGLQAQSTKVELSGTVSDPAALPVEGADVKLLNVGTGAEQAYVTASNGEYHFFGLRPASYTLTVTKTGFNELQREGLTLRVGD